MYLPGHRQHPPLNHATSPAAGGAEPFTRYCWIGVGAERIEMMHARFSRHRFAPHAHATWAVGTVLAGAKDLALPSQAPQLVRRGEVYVIAPELAHAGPGRRPA
jgi:hypothetical protein